MTIHTWSCLFERFDDLVLRAATAKGLALWYEQAKPLYGQAALLAIRVRVNVKGLTGCDEKFHSTGRLQGIIADCL